MLQCCASYDREGVPDDINDVMEYWLKGRIASIMAKPVASPAAVMVRVPSITVPAEYEMILCPLIVAV
jgi:hypothetical protein